MAHVGRPERIQCICHRRKQQFHFQYTCIQVSFRCVLRQHCSSINTKNKINDKENKQNTEPTTDLKYHREQSVCKSSWSIRSVFSSENNKNQFMTDEHNSLTRTFDQERRSIEN